MSNLRRIENCPCGSGQAPAQCCLGNSIALLLEAKFCERLRQFAQHTRGPRWFQQAREDLQLESEDQEFFEYLYSKLVYFHYGQPTLFESFLAQRPALSADEATLVWSLRQARLSIFKILKIRRGQAVYLQDLLFGDRVWVAEGTLAEPDMLNAVLLARLAPFGQEVLMLGMYVRPMAAWKADLIMEELRQQAGPDLEPGLLRQSEWAARLCARWRRGLQELDEFSMPLQTTSEGEQICRVRDRFAFEPEQAGAVRQALNDFPELYWDCRQTARWLVGPSELGRISLQSNALILECDSLGRAERLGENLREIPGLKGRRRHRSRALDDAAIRKIYEKWSSRWPEEALPALGGLTPRQAVASSEGRHRVQEILREFETYQNTLPPTQSIRIDILRSKLGLQ